MKVLSVTNTKGGTGKSTISLILCTCLAAEKKKILLLDCDIQSTSFEMYQLEESPLFEVRKSDVSKLERELIKAEKDGFDIVFLDFARFTEENTEMLSFLSICDLVLIPTLGGIIEILSVQKFVKFLKASNVSHSIFLNKYRGLKEDKETLSILSEQTEVFKSHVQDLKLFKDVNLSSSILSTKEGQKRFKLFYDEFKILLS